MKKITLNILILFTFLAIGQNALHSMQKRKAPTFECPECFIEVTNLARHRNIHLKERPYQCDLCNRGFNDSSNYKVHFDTEGNCKQDTRKKHIVPVSKKKEISSSIIRSQKNIPLVSSKKYIPAPPIKKEYRSPEKNTDFQSRFVERIKKEIILSNRDEHSFYFLHNDSLIEHNTYPLHDNCFEWTEK